MSFINNKTKEDLQDDTFKQIATLNWSCMLYLGEKDVEGIVSCMNILYLTCWKKMAQYIPKGFEEELNQLEHDINQEGLDGYQRTEQLMRARKLYKGLAGGLSDAGLLFRATLSSGSIGMREEL